MTITIRYQTLVTIRLPLKTVRTQQKSPSYKSFDQIYCLALRVIKNLVNVVMSYQLAVLSPVIKRITTITFGTQMCFTFPHNNIPNIFPPMSAGSLAGPEGMRT